MKKVSFFKILFHFRMINERLFVFHLLRLLVFFFFIFFLRSCTPSSNSSNDRQGASSPSSSFQMAFSKSATICEGVNLKLMNLQIALSFFLFPFPFLLPRSLVCPLTASSWSSWSSSSSSLSSSIFIVSVLALRPLHIIRHNCVVCDISFFNVHHLLAICFTLHPRNSIWRFVLISFQLKSTASLSFTAQKMI